MLDDKTFTAGQLDKLSDLAIEKDLDEQHLLREALDDLLHKYEIRKKSASGKTIMLVDDSTFMRAAMREMVQKSGYKVLGEAENGKLGAQYYSNFWVDFILLGIQMPVMDGLEFLKSIKKRKGCRVIVVTAACKAKAVLEAIELGADYFILKPFTGVQMIDTLSMHETEYFTPENLQKYSDYFYKTLGYAENTRVSQEDIDALRECE